MKSARALRPLRGGRAGKSFLRPTQLLFEKSFTFIQLELFFHFSFFPPSLEILFWFFLSIQFPFRPSKYSHFKVSAYRVSSPLLGMSVVLMVTIKRKVFFSFFFFGNSKEKTMQRMISWGVVVGERYTKVKGYLSTWLRDLTWNTNSIDALSKYLLRTSSVQSIINKVNKKFIWLSGQSIYKTLKFQIIKNSQNDLV